MNLNYEEVPNILTGKDMDYLSDMFEWNVGALKFANQFVNDIENQDIRDVLHEAYQTHQENLYDVIRAIEEGGQNE